MWNKFYQKYKHAWVFFYGIIYSLWFALLEKRTDVPFNNMHIFLDDYIPFHELFIIPYLLWFAYIATTVIFFFLTDKKGFYQLISFLTFGMTICLIIYTIWPNAQNLRPESFIRDNVFVNIVKNLYLTDTSTNVCPSIHVYNSIAAHIAISHSEFFSKKRVLRIASATLMILICLSTVFLKQHSVFDGLCSFALATIMYLLIYRLDYNRFGSKPKAKATNY